MNTKLIPITAFTALFLTLTSAHAAPPTADLQVKGQLVVPVCTVAATDDGTYDLGALSSTMIKPAATTVLPTISKTWTISCDAETYLNLTPHDNRADSVSTLHRDHHGLGFVNETGKIGYYTTAISNPKVDGVSSKIVTTTGDTVTNAFDKDLIIQGYRTVWAANTTTQKSGKVFSADISITPTLASSASMNGPITEEANIDGSLTLTFAFGM